MIQVLRQLNLAVVENDRNSVINALKDTALKLQTPTSPDNASLYLKLFKKCLTEKHFDGSELWLEDVEAVTKIVAQEAENVQKGMSHLCCPCFFKLKFQCLINVFRFFTVCTFLSQVNLGLQRKDMLFTTECLQTFGFKIPDKYKTECFQNLCDLKDSKQENYNCAIVRYITPKGNESYLDLRKYNYTWDCPRNISETCFLTMQDIKVSCMQEI